MPNNEYDEEENSDEDVTNQQRRSVFFPGTGSETENTQPKNTDIYPGGILNIPIPPGQATGTNW